MGNSTTLGSGKDGPFDMGIFSRILIISLPYGIYLLSQNALMQYVQANGSL